MQAKQTVYHDHKEQSIFNGFCLPDVPGNKTVNPCARKTYNPRDHKEQATVYGFYFPGLPVNNTINNTEAGVFFKK